MSSYVISVSLGTGCYRHIQISQNATLYRLHKAIISAFDFDDDHAHAFFMDNRAWSDWDAYYSMKSEGYERLTKSAKLNKLGLSKGKQFKYIFDFGDEWTFQCKVLRPLEEDIKTPSVIRSVGEAPQQYPSWDEDEDWEEDDEDWEEDDEDWEDNEGESEEWNEEYEPNDEGDDLVPYADEENAEEDEINFFPEILPQRIIQSLFKDLPLSINAIRTIHLYFDAAVRLYGIIPVGLIMDIYNTQNKPVDPDVFFALVSIMCHEENSFIILPSEEDEDDSGAISSDMMVIDICLLSDGSGEELLELVQKQKDTPYFVPPKKEFLKYADRNYFPSTPESEAMLQYLLSRNHLPDPHVTLLDLQTMCEDDLPLERVLKIQAMCGLRFKTKADLDTFTALFMDLNNHTRKTVIRGFTPIELENTPKSEHSLYFKPDIDGQLSIFD